MLGWMGGRVDGWMDGWEDGGMNDELMDGQMVSGCESGLMGECSVGSISGGEQMGQKQLAE